MGEIAPQDRTSELIRFYELLSELEVGSGGARTMRDCSGRLPWPSRGVYFFLDPNEPCEVSPGGIRVVRVGTHALKAGSRSTIWGRLRTHRGTLTCSGNHRASVFRRHVGEAMIAYGQCEKPVLSWGKPQPRESYDRTEEINLERRVSK